MDTLFKSSSTFASLSLKDLIQARDLFHYHLMNKKNVVGTAVGLYRIRKTDPWPSKGHPQECRRSPKSTRRTLFNSEVRPYSWPCVYVFVSSWQEELDLARRDPTDVVPMSLFLPDGRAVPVCVIEALLQDYSKDLQLDVRNLIPRNALTPGCAIVNADGHGMTRLATAGCVVRDGASYYALTNRHAVGKPGTVIGALQSHREPRIGSTCAKGLTRRDFGEIYPNFSSTRQRLLMDVGLVELDDILQWKTQVSGIAPIRPALDLYDNSFNLKLITLKVVGQSAVSGLLRGEIHALFYRFKAIGGFEYISDFLIGPETYSDDPAVREIRAGQHEGADENFAFAVHHGDSGTLLFIEYRPESDNDKDKPNPPVYYPFALLWGREEFYSDGTTSTHPFALATALSTALDQLNLDLVWDLNLDQELIWGWVGHYAIGRALPLATDLLTSRRLTSFITRNLDLLAVTPDASLGNDPRVLTKGNKTPHFVALADVPDNVWKGNVNFVTSQGPGGKTVRTLGPGNRHSDDNPNHFADLDMLYLGGKTFLELNHSDPDRYLNPKAWVQYFATISPQLNKWQKLLTPNAPPKNHWGALPFRVHQLFDVMVAAAKRGDAKLFLCAGGVLIHYMGDACQPLHTSYLSQGDPARVVKRPNSDSMKLEADGVHSGYEDDMIAYGYQTMHLAQELQVQIGKLKKAGMPQVQNGFDASKAVIELIVATQTDIVPRDIVDKWVELNGTPKKQKAVEMWDEFGERTVVCMARGTRYLAHLWQSAWDLGKGDNTIGNGSALKPADLRKLYENPAVVPSVPLDHYPDDPMSDWSKIERSTS